ncbi:MAG: hypothetical protein L0154_01730 [Chloroflexi bacterium]|nr:hypothetical protein [Chloroflexota bacterium]
MHIPKNWRIKSQRYQMQTSVNENGNVEFPPRPVVKQRLVERYSFDTEEEVLQEQMAS